MTAINNFSERRIFAVIDIRPLQSMSNNAGWKYPTNQKKQYPAFQMLYAQKTDRRLHYLVINIAYARFFFLELSDRNFRITHT